MIINIDIYTKQDVTNIDCRSNLHTFIHTVANTDFTIELRTRITDSTYIHVHHI